MTAKSETPKYVGELVIGANYILFDPQTRVSRHYKPGERWVFSEADMVHLEANALHMRTMYDPMTGDALGEPVSMFSFAAFDGPEPAGHRFPTVEELEAAEVAKAARARSRRIALAKAAVDVAPAPARARARSRAAA